MIVGEVLAKFNSDISGFNNGIKEVKKGIGGVSEGISGFGKDMAKVGGIMTLAVTLPILGMGAMFVKAAASEQEAVAKIDSMITAMTGNSKEAFDRVKASVEGVSEAYIKLGFDDEDTAVAFTKLLKATDDVDEANKMLALSADLARYKNIDLSDAQRLVMMAYSGSTKELKQMGIAIEDNMTVQEKLAAIQENVKGQAEAYSKTFKGQMEILNVQTENLMESFGKKLLPLLIQFLTVVTSLVDKFNGLSDSQQNTILIIGGIIAVIGPAILIIGSIVTAITTIGTALTAVAAIFGLALGPFLLLFAAIAIGIALGVLLYKNWDTIKEKAITIFTSIADFLSEIWNKITTEVKNAWSWIKTSIITPITETWNVVKSTIGEMYSGIKTKFEEMLQTVKDVWSNVKDAIINPVKEAWESVKGWLKSIHEGIREALNKDTKGSPSIQQTIDETVGAIKNAVRDVSVGLDIPKHLIGVGGALGNGTVGVVVNLDGANIISAQVAEEYAEIIGDAVIKKLSRSTRI